MCDRLSPCTSVSLIPDSGQLFCSSTMNENPAAEIVPPAHRPTLILTELTDVIIGVGLRHGSDGDKGAAVSPQSFTKDVLSQVDLRGPQSLQLGQVHLRVQ